MSCCKHCGIELSGNYKHWAISGFPYCDICFELMVTITTSRWLRKCQREYVHELAKRRKMLRGN